VHDPRAGWAAQVPQPDRVVEAARHEAIVGRGHLEADDALCVALEVAKKLVVVQGEVSEIESRTE
jgi:hypothetical protein